MKNADAWEQRALNEMVVYEASTLTVNDAFSSGQYPLFDAKGHIGFTNKHVIKSAYISVVKDGAGVGRIRLLPRNTAVIATMGALTAISTSDLSFIFALLSLHPLQDEASGSTIPHIYFRDYGNKNFAVPGHNEQIVLGDIFSRLDHMLALHQRKQKTAAREVLRGQQHPQIDRPIQV